MKVQEVVFMQGEEANEAMLILSREGAASLLEHLADTHYGLVKDEELKDVLFVEDLVSPTDSVFKSNDFVLSYNTRLGYCGLIKVIK